MNKINDSLCMERFGIIPNFVSNQSQVIQIQKKKRKEKEI